MKKIAVLGAGLVGSAIALDLAHDFEVTSIDIKHETLKGIKNKNPDINTECLNVANKNDLSRIIDDKDIIVGCLPGYMGFEIDKFLIENKKNIVDISFFPEDMFLLDEIAKKSKVTTIVDCGVAPGMGNIILGYHNERMKIKDYRCYVGGLPKQRDWPYEYKAVFSPIDVIEEYIRPARYIQNGELVIKEALSDSEYLQFEGVGTLEAWNSDGLRSILNTMPNIPNMIEKTMRYPGTIEYLKVLRATGFFSYNSIEIDGHKIRPIDLTSKLLFPKWKLKPGEVDMTIMRIIIEGEENEIMKRYTYDLFDSYDKDTDTISMARTTGYTCTAAVNLIANGLYSNYGVNPPEFLGKDENNFQYILDYLKQRNVIYNISEEVL